MSAILSMSGATLTSAHRDFEAALPAIDRALRFHFRRWPRARREEALADGRAAAWHAWHGLLRRGKDPIAVGVTGLCVMAYALSLHETGYEPVFTVAGVMILALGHRLNLMAGQHSF